jgi:hypothetical protein
MMCGLKDGDVIEKLAVARVVQKSSAYAETRSSNTGLHPQELGPAQA